VREPLLVLNAGSSSIKFSVYETLVDRSLAAGAHGEVEGIGTAARLEVADSEGQALTTGPVAGAGYEAAIEAIQAWFAAHVGNEAGFDGVGHRVVHGGMNYAEPILIDESVIAGLEKLIPLAPLHEAHHIAVIRAVQAVAPQIRQVACFDTAFHRTAPALAQEFALPREFTAKGVRRYGFHGLSYEYIVETLRNVAPEVIKGKVVAAHLGNGASMCAMDHGRSQATTMGFTAVDGLPMGTRTGTLDPGVILYLLQQEGMDVGAVERLIYEQSGLLGVSGLSSDMRTLLASDKPAAKEAVSLFIYRIGRELGSLAAALGGLDAIVFTGGIGEHAAEIRERVCRNAAWLGVAIDEAANLNGGPCITRNGSKVSAWVISTDENLMIARHTRHVLDVGKLP
jgi:acetate kinase